MGLVRTVYVYYTHIFFQHWTDIMARSSKKASEKADPGTGDVAALLEKKMDADAKSERIDLRATPRVKALLRHAATDSYKNLSEFILDAAISAATERVADQRVFRLDDDQWRVFQDALDRPVSKKPELAKLLVEKSVLE